MVLALGIRSDCSLARLRAGEATSLVLLRATMSGLATCPVTEPLEIAETRDVVQRELFGDKASPQMLLRIGVGTRRPQWGQMFHTAPPAIVDWDVRVGDGVALVSLVFQNDDASRHRHSGAVRRVCVAGSGGRRG